MQKRIWCSWSVGLTLVAASCAANKGTDNLPPGPHDDGTLDSGVFATLDMAAPVKPPPDPAANPARDASLSQTVVSTGDRDANAASTTVDANAANVRGDDVRVGTMNGRDVSPGASPCPTDGTPCKIMPMGDSITGGIGSLLGGGYRDPLFRTARTNKKNITFVGSFVSGPATVDGVPFPRNHLAVGGYTIDPIAGHAGISMYVPDRLILFKPHIITLMIGTNDLTDTTLDLPNAPKRLAGLLDKIFAALPDVVLVVAQVVASRDDVNNVRVRAFNAAIPALVQARAAAGRRILMVDMYSAFVANAAYKSAYLSDNLHPTDAGYAKMSDIWYAAIGNLLN